MHARMHHQTNHQAMNTNNSQQHSCLNNTININSRRQHNTTQQQTMKDLNLKDPEEAEIYLRENTHNVRCNIHPSMLAILGPTTMTGPETKKLIQANTVQCNHNTLNANKVYSIMNNIMGNFLHLKDTPNREFGTDAEFIVMQWDKVR